ncbi:MAG: carbohydrate kinase family protein [Chitinophagaceae bacterium]
MQNFSADQMVLCIGEVLWDILPNGRKIGGAPLNVTYHLNKLGINARLLSRIGQDEPGKEISSFFKKNGLDQSLLQIDLKHPTGRVEATLGENHEVSYDIIRDVAWDFIENKMETFELLLNSEFLIFGSLITRSAISRATLNWMLERPCIRVLDVNLRPPFYSREILKELLLKADIVKMNESELKILAGWFGFKGSDQENMQGLYKAFDLDILITTHGSMGAYLIHGNSTLFEPGHPIIVADTVGSGDAFLAGFLSELMTGSPLQHALKTASGMGAFIAQMPGGCPPYQKKEFHQFLYPSLT